MLFRRCIASFVIGIFLLSSVVTPVVSHAADYSAPVVRLSMDRGAPEKGEALPVSAAVTDDQNVSRVVLRYRELGTSEPFLMIPMKQSAASKLYVISIPADKVAAPGIEYFIEATDGMGNVSQEPFPSHPRQIPIEGSTAVAEGKTNWLWVVAGAVVIGALAGGGGGGGGSGGDDQASSTLTITAPTP